MLNVPEDCWYLHHSTFIVFIGTGKEFFFVKTSATDEKYPVLNRESLMIPIQKQLSQKPKTFCHVFAAFLKFRLNFEYFEEKDDPHSFCISEITDSENVVR